MYRRQRTFVVRPLKGRVACHDRLRPTHGHRDPDRACRLAAPTKRAAGGLRAVRRGEVSRDDLEAQQDAAVRDSIERAEATGAPIISDGEQRWSSFATYAIADTLAGTGLADHLARDGGQYFAIFADGHRRQLPRLTSGPFRYKTYAADTLAKSIGLAHKPMKQAVIAPSMLALLYPLDGEVPGYSREEFESDLVDECEKDIRKAFAAGAARVSVDFTEGGSRPGTTRATRGPAGTSAALHRSQQPRVRTLLGAGAHPDRRAHLPRRRP